VDPESSSPVARNQLECLEAQFDEHLEARLEELLLAENHFRNNWWNM
jgi:hypothetical protein